jgi:predicted transcriptional regulator
MNAITIPLSPETAETVAHIARERGVSVELLMADMAKHMVQQFETHKLFLEEAERGRAEISEALALLNRP